VKPKNKKIVAIASAGGHFQQLMQLRPGFSHENVTYLTTLEGLPQQFDAIPWRIIPDCNSNTPLRVFWAAIIIGIEIAKNRPHVVLSTGALPGVIALGWGRLFGARTIWIDSVANAETLSSSGKLARRVAHVTLSQWQRVAEQEAVLFKGSIL